MIKQINKLEEEVDEAYAAKYPGIELHRVIHLNHCREGRVENHSQDAAKTFIMDHDEKHLK